MNILAKENIFFILISTDYVFDGKNPPYKEDDTPNPLQAYGKSKYEAELVTQKISKSNNESFELSIQVTI
jgi:dTDP-4-dehydrorhamnose reductase